MPTEYIPCGAYATSNKASGDTTRESMSHQSVPFVLTASVHAVGRCRKRYASATEKNV